MSSSSGPKRHSVLPPISQAGPKPPVQFSSSITIADSAILTGTNPIVIGSESVIHPRVRIDSLGGNIFIGRRCIVQERTRIGHMGSEGKITEDAVTLEDYVTVEVGATIEAGETHIGEGTVLGVGCTVGRGTVIGKYCTITPRSVLQPGERVPDFTVVYSNMRRPDKRGVVALRNKGQTRQIEVLRRMIPSNPAKFM